MKNISKQLIIFCILFCGFTYPSFSQNNVNEKRSGRKNLIVKEYKTDGKLKDRVLETVVIYDERGYKVEEIEYATHGIKERTTYEYDENNRCYKEISYDDRDKVKRIRKIEYNEDGTKKAHYNYLPNGRLYSTKQYEYSKR